MKTCAILMVIAALLLGAGWYVFGPPSGYSWSGLSEEREFTCRHSEDLRIKPEEYAVRQVRELLDNAVFLAGVEKSITAAGCLDEGDLRRLEVVIDSVHSNTKSCWVNMTFGARGVAERTGWMSWKSSVYGPDERLGFLYASTLRSRIVKALVDRFGEDIQGDVPGDKPVRQKTGGD